MHTSKKPQSVPQARPDAFDRVYVNLSGPVFISVFGPSRVMVNGFSRSGFFLPFEPKVGAILIGKNGRFLRRTFGNY